jgi:hypothetical protein
MPLTGTRTTPDTGGLAGGGVVVHDLVFCCPAEVRSSRSVAMAPARWAVTVPGAMPGSEFRRLYEAHRAAVDAYYTGRAGDPQSAAGGGTSSCGYGSTWKS